MWIKATVLTQVNEEDCEDWEKSDDNPWIETDAYIDTNEISLFWKNGKMVFVQFKGADDGLVVESPSWEELKELVSQEDHGRVAISLPVRES